MDFWTGIKLYSSPNCTIYGNNITSTEDGIYLSDNSNHTNVYGNTVVNNGGSGIRLASSSNCSIYGNHIEANDNYGITISASSYYIDVYGNNITENDLYGVFLADSSNFTDIFGNLVTANVGGIYLYDSSNHNNIFGNNVTSNDGYGINLHQNSNYNNVSGNSVTENYVGVGVTGALNNTIVGNNVTNNDYGIWLSASSNNSIYHNYFINNTQQAIATAEYANSWDDGYPSGGNYWSDFPDRYPLVGDSYSGPSQNETGSDGFWDGPYFIEEDNQDNYPVVPEFPTWTSILPILIVLTAAVAVYKRKLLRASIR